MTRIIGIAGSLRKGSYNRMLLRAAVEAAPEGVTIEAGSIEGIPLYDGDVEQEQGVPAAAAALKDAVAAADGLLLVTPECNRSIPGVFKNAIDWMSRPPRDIPRVFGNKPVGLIGASSGSVGTRMAQAAWLPVLRTLGTRPWFGRELYVADAAKVFDASGALIDAKVKELLATFVTGFAEFVAAQAGARSR